jgi:UDP-N-acetylmuramoyl-L-alanyl-D-glutamate--2,6-diaminopimelate ligase
MKELLKKVLPLFLLDWYHYFLSFLGAVLYGFPSRKLHVIGVTGTNGKTTTVNMITSILEEAGLKVASISSARFRILGKEKPNDLKMTMPGRFIIKRFLRNAVDVGCQYAVIEVASEGIKQHRQKFIDFKTAVFTNLSPEHIEAHRGFENYRKAKGEFFKSVKETQVVNIDDPNADFFLKFPAQKKYLYGIENQGSGEFLKAEQVKTFPDHIEFVVRGIPFKLNLIGSFNVYNALAAISVGLSLNIDLDVSRKALEKARGVPGRMEEAVSSPFRVFIDYAFTPNALEKVYKTLRQTFNPSQMICVLGSCGGGRDKWKRPVLGELAAKYCDKVIVTNEDPYDEDPLEIIEQVSQGAKGKAEKILDRREAIAKALKTAKEKDLVIITGKGCESCIMQKGRRIPWSEREVIEQELKKI